MARAEQKRAKPRNKPKGVERILRGIFGGLFRMLWWLGLRAATAGAVVLALAAAYYYAQLPGYAELLDARERGSVTMIDAREEVFAWRGDHAAVTRVDAVSPHLVNAVIATEDRRFFSHFGIDLRGTARALAVNLREGRTVQGGSSITQQVAKLVWFDNTRTLERKLKEVPAALALELKFSKEEILSIYLNRAYLGAGATGFEAASQRYFGKSAAEVSAAEAAMLAGLLRAPSRYSPTNDLDLAQDRAGTIVGLMEREGYLSAQEAAAAIERPAQLSAAAEARAGGSFADWIMTDGPDFLTRATTEDVDDQRPFIAALVTLDPDALPQWLQSKGKDTGLTAEELREDPDVLAEIETAVTEANKAVSQAESIKKFAVLGTDFTEDNGMLTPSLKLKRTVVLERFGAEVDALYTR